MHTQLTQVYANNPMSNSFLRSYGGRPQNGGTRSFSSRPNGFQNGGSKGDFGGQRNGGYNNQRSSNGWGNQGGGFGGGKSFGAGGRMNPVEWGNKTLQPFKKDFYQEHEVIGSRSDFEVTQFRSTKEITIEGDCPKPIQSFHEANFPDYVLDAIVAQGYENPTAIQAQGWPIAMSGHNMVGIAQTGSGENILLHFSYKLLFYMVN